MEVLKVPSAYRGMRIVYKYDDVIFRMRSTTRLDDFNVSEELNIIEYQFVISGTNCHGLSQKAPWFIIEGCAASFWKVDTFFVTLQHVTLRAYQSRGIIHYNNILKHVSLWQKFQQNILKTH